MDVRASPENKIHTSRARVFKFRNTKIFRGCPNKKTQFHFFRESQNSVAEMNIFRLAGDMSHLLAILLLLAKIWKSKSVVGLSGKSQVRFGFGF